MDMPEIFWKHTGERADPVWSGVVSASWKACQEKVGAELSLKGVRYRG